MVNFKKIAPIFFNFLTLKKNKMFFKLFLTTFVCGFHFMIGFTQENDLLYYKLEFRKAYPFKNKDDVTKQQFLASKLSYYRKKGNLLYSIDSIEIKNDSIITWGYKGQKFTKSQLHFSISNNETFSAKVSSSFSNKFTTSVLNPFEIDRYLKLIQQKFLDVGYPFTTILVDSFQISSPISKIYYSIHPYQHFTWGTIHLKGNLNTNKKQLELLSSISTNSNYQERIKNNSTQRISQFPFIQTIKNSEVVFTNDSVDLYLYLNETPINRINGLMGFQPTTNGTYNITGDIDLKLYHKLKKLETIEFNWKSLPQKTQQLKGLINFPFLFRSPIGIETEFNLFKKDSSFIEVSQKYNLQYLTQNGLILKTYYNNYNSNKLGSNSQNTEKNISINYYGVAISHQKLDHIITPTKGYKFKIDLAAGLRKNSEGTTTSYKLQLGLETYLPLSQRNILKISTQNEVLIQPFFVTNELLRFGGLTTQRGFKEQDMTANKRNTSTIEYRYLLENNAYLFLFYDQSWYENKLSAKTYDHPSSFGGGISFATEIGLFNLTYALGRQMNNPIFIKDGVIHLGYTSLF